MTKSLLDIAIDELDFCSCGLPEDTIKIIRIMLEELNIFKEKRTERLKKLPLEHPEEFMYLLLYFLDSKGLIEHGCSIRGSWLTDKGEELLKNIQEAKEEDD